MNLNFSLDFSSTTSLSSKSSNKGVSKPDPSIIYDVLIIGGGPAGLNAALYAKRKGLEVGLITGILGGQVMDTSSVDNYLGIKDITGEALVHQFVQHVEQLQIPIYEHAFVEEVKPGAPYHQVILSSGEVYQTATVILATGSKPKQLGIPGEMTFAGRGVAYCAICDAPLFKGKDVLIAGGGNSAVEAALDLSKIARSVKLVHRSQLRADKILIDQLYQTENLQIFLETTILEIIGDRSMTAIHVKNNLTKEEYEIDGDGIFIEIGHQPNALLYEGLVDFNDHGEVLVNDKNETSIPGLFAAGDVTQVPYKQIIIATSDGAKAALAANEYIHYNQPIFSLGGTL